MNGKLKYHTVYFWSGAHICDVDQSTSNCNILALGKTIKYELLQEICRILVMQLVSTINSKRAVTSLSHLPKRMVPICRKHETGQKFSMKLSGSRQEALQLVKMSIDQQYVPQKVIPIFFTAKKLPCDKGMALSFASRFYTKPIPLQALSIEFLYKRKLEALRLRVEWCQEILIRSSSS